MSYFEFPHTRTYEGDLGFIIKNLEKLMHDYENFFTFNSITFADPIEWDITKQYPAFTIVFDTANESSYISKKPVPAGITLDNQEFWNYVGSLLVDGPARMEIERILRFTTNIYESGLVASANRVPGDFVIVGGELYKVIDNINAGVPYAVNVNTEKTTIENMAADIVEKLKPVDSEIDINSNHAVSNHAVAAAIQALTDIVNAFDDDLIDIRNEIANTNTELNSVNINLNARLDQTNNTLAQTNTALSQETADRQAQDNVLNSRINSLANLQEGSTTGDAELIDGRTGANGYTWSNIGNAIRGQANQTNKIINNLNFRTGSTLEQGNIGIDGSLVASNKNFRLVDFMNPAVYMVSCSNYYKFAIATYNPDGSFVSRSSFDYSTFNGFDHVNYKYKVTFKRVDDADCTPDTQGTHFHSVVGDVAETKALYNEDLSIPVVWEQGNISGIDGSNTASPNNIRTKFYIPENVTSIIADEGYVMAVSRRLKLDNSFVDRSAYNIKYYDSFDFSMYTYRICMAKASTIEAVTPSDADHVKFNTALLDQLQINTRDIKNLAPATLPLLNDHVNANGYKVIARSLMGLKTFENFDSNGFNLTDASLNSHDATMCVVNNKIYVVRAMYLTHDNASSNDCKIVLTKCDLDGSNQVNIDVAKYGDTLGGYSITGGCGSPNLIVVGTDIHIFFTCGTDNTYYIFHVAYDTSTSTFGSYSPITIDGSICNVRNSLIFFDFAYSLGGFTGLQMNSSIAFDGTYYYAGVTEGTADPDGRGIIIKSTDLISWSIFVKIPSVLARPVYEVAVGYVNSKIVITTRSDYESRKSLIAVYDLSGNMLDSCYALNGCTRPDLLNADGSLILLNSEDSTRKSVSLTVIDVDNLINSDMQYQAYYTGTPIQYLRGYVDNNYNLYGVCTYRNADKYAIHVGPLNLSLVSYDDITNALDNLIP